MSNIFNSKYFILLRNIMIIKQNNKDNELEYQYNLLFEIISEKIAIKNIF
jgi:hypothetical protein